MSTEISRRDLLCSVAAALLVSHVPSNLNWEEDPSKDVNWEEVLNKVIGDRNAWLMGFDDGIGSYEIGSPEWCMEEALAGQGLLAKGAPIHV